MAKVRRIEGLISARLVDEGPWGEAEHRSARKCIRDGHSYERNFGRYLVQMPKPPDAEILAGQWIAFEDKNGPGHAQPDFIIKSPRGLIIFECKLTENSRAWIQLFDLYSPLLEHLFQLPMKRVQVCKNLKGLAQEAPVVSGAGTLQDNCIWNWRPGALSRSVLRSRKIKEPA